MKLCIVLFFLLASFLETLGQKRDSSYYDRLYRRGSSYASGPNMCAVQKIQLSKGKTIYMEAQTTNTISRSRDVCGRRPYTTYECCAGYQYYTGWPGCSQTVPLTSVINTLKGMQQDSFAQAIEDTGMNSTFTKQGPFTIFAPTDEAFTEAEGSALESVKGRNGLLFHVASRKISLDNLKDGDRIETMSGITKLYVSKENEKDVLVNCARVIRPNVMSKNGMVHLIDKVLNGFPRGLTDILWEDKRLSKFRNLVSRSRLMGTLLREGPMYTLLAPTDDAFAKLPKEMSNRIMSGDRESLETILKYHIIPGYICSDSVTSKREFATLEGGKLSMTCKPGKGMVIDSAEMLQTDITASNGVLHVIDKVLIPPNGNDILSLAKLLGLKEFVKTIQQAGLENSLMLGGPYTIFAPSDSAFRTMSHKDRARLQDKTKLKDIVQFHIAFGRRTSEELMDDDELSSLNVPRKIRVKIYRTGMSVENACVEKTDNMAANGVIHVIDRVLFPPEQDVLQIIQNDAYLKDFANALVKSGVSSRLSEPGQFTVFAPSRSAMRRNWRLSRLIRNPTPKLKQIMTNHIIDDLYVVCAFQDSTFLALNTTTGKRLNVRRNYGRLIIRSVNAQTSQTNIMGSNGVIHIVDEVLDLRS